MDHLDKLSRLRVPSRINTTPFVTIIILSSNATMEKFEQKDLLLMVNVQLPRSGSLDEFSAIVHDLVKQRFPNYQGDFSCDCLESDVTRGTQQGMDLIASKQLTMAQMTPGFLLSLIGRVFVMLKSPLGAPGGMPPFPPRGIQSRTERPHKPPSISSDLVDEDIACNEPMPYTVRSPRSSRASVQRRQASVHRHDNLSATLSFALSTISRSMWETS